MKTEESQPLYPQFILYFMNPNKLASLTRVVSQNQNFSRSNLGIIKGGDLVSCMKRSFRAETVLRYKFPSLLAVDTFRHFGARILNSMIKSLFLTGKIVILDLFFKCE